jgi:hypothetical protein
MTFSQCPQKTARSVRWSNHFGVSDSGEALNRCGYSNRNAAVRHAVRAPRIASLCFSLAAFLFATASSAGQSNPAPPSTEESYIPNSSSLPDLPEPQTSPQPAGKASAACLLKRAAVGMGWAAAQTGIVSQGNDAALGAAAAIGKPVTAPASDNDAMLVPCTTIERVISKIQVVKKLPPVNLYQRFLDGPQVLHMTPEQKAWLAARNVADPFNALTIMGSSAIAVAANSHSPYGPGFTGWGRYVGVSFTQNMTAEFFNTFLIPSIVHQDPHYYRMPTASIKRRIAHVFYHTVWTQGDNGKGMLNYADLVGFGIDDEISNLYVPGRQTNARATAERYGIALALAPTDSAITEFLPDIARKIHIRIVLVQQIINQVAANKSNAASP